jgi:hypothetical protein
VLRLEAVTLTELPRTLWGRKVRPLSLAFSLVALSTAWALLVDRNAPGQRLDGTDEGFAIGLFSLLSALFLWAGFWRKSDWLMLNGLWMMTGVFGARYVYVGLDTGFFSEPARMSVCWVVASIGAFLLEATTGAVATARRARE